MNKTLITNQLLRLEMTKSNKSGHAFVVVEFNYLRV